jgi:hypothetical protein
MAEYRSLIDVEGERQVQAIQDDYELWLNLPRWERKCLALLGWYYMLDRAWIVLAFGVALIVISLASLSYRVPWIAAVVIGGSGFVLGVIALLELLRRR